MMWLQRQYHFLQTRGRGYQVGNKIAPFCPLHYHDKFGKTDSKDRQTGGGERLIDTVPEMWSDNFYKVAVTIETERDEQSQYLERERESERVRETDRQTQ